MSPARATDGTSGRQKIGISTADESNATSALVLTLANAQAMEVRLPFPDEAIPVRARVSAARTGEAASEVVELGPVGADGTTLARRLDDGAIMRLTRSVARRFRPQPLALRAPAVWQKAIDAASVVGIDDSCGGAHQRLERRGDGWTMRAPAGFAVDPASTSDLARAVAQAKAEAWIAERDDGTFGLGGATSCVVTLTVDTAPTDGAPRAASLVFGAAGDQGVYARTLDEPAVFEVPVALRELVSRPAIDCQRVRLDPRAMERVIVTGNGARVVLVRAGD